MTRNIFCVGWNYLEHFAEGAKMRDASQKLPKHPVFFTKATGALNGPFDPIPYDPSISREVDWEVELAAVIGKRGRNISEAEAADHVFGYTVLNDVSARDLQKTGMAASGSRARASMATRRWGHGSSLPPISNRITSVSFCA